MISENKQYWGERINKNINKQSNNFWSSEKISQRSGRVHNITVYRSLNRAKSVRKPSDEMISYRGP